MTDTRSNFTPTRRQRGFPEYPFGVAAVDITSLDAIESTFHGSSRSRDTSLSSDSTTFKLNTKEYQDLDIKVGDKVSIEIKKQYNDLS